MNHRNVSYTVFIFLILSAPTLSQELDREIAERQINTTDKKKVINTEPSKTAFAVNESGFAGDEINSNDVDELTRAVFLNEKFSGESDQMDCSFRTDYGLARKGVQLQDKCFEVVDQNHQKLLDRAKTEFITNSKSGDKQTDSAQYQAAANIIQMKMTKTKENCSLVLSRNLKVLAARFNWVYNVGVHSARNSCKKAWEKLSHKSGSCGSNQTASLKKFNELYSKFDAVKHSNQGSQFMAQIEQLSSEKRGCSSTATRDKKFKCSIFVKRLKRGLVKCKYKNEAGTRKTVFSKNSLYDFVSGISLSIEEFLIPSAHAGSMWDTFRGLSGTVAEGLVDNDQRLAPYVYDPMVRGVTYQAILNGEEETASTYGKIVGENHSQSSVAIDLQNELKGATGQISDSVLAGVLDINPSNPSALTAANLAALNKLTENSNTCPFGKTSKGGCYESNLTAQDFPPITKKQKAQIGFFNPRGNAHRATALKEVSNGRLWSPRMQNAISELKKENGKLLSDPKAPTLESYRRLAKAGGLKLPKATYTQTNSRNWKKLSKIFNPEGGSTTSLLGSSANKNSDKSPSTRTETSKTSTVTFAKKGKNADDEEWDDPTDGSYANVSDKFFDHVIGDQENEEYQMPASAQIESNRDTNLFQIISARYFKTGFRKLQLGRKSGRQSASLENQPTK